MVIAEFTATFSTDHIIVGGDFNRTPDEWMDRWPSLRVKETLNPILKEFVNNTKLLDVWRAQHNGVKQFTWHKPNGQSRSCIDYWLVSAAVLECVKETEIANCPLSDHCVVNLKLQKLNKCYKPNNYWKFNANLLTNLELCQFIKELILNISNDNSIVTPILKREYLKYSIRKYSIKFSKDLNRKRRDNGD